MHKSKLYSHSAREYLHNYYLLQKDQHIYHSFDFIVRVAAFATEIAAAEKVTERAMDQIELCALFLYAGKRNILQKDDNYILLFRDFAEKIKLETEDNTLILSTIDKTINDIHPETLIEQIIHDVKLMPFLDNNIIETAIVLADELTRITGQNITEIDMLHWYRSNIINSFFITRYVVEKYKDVKDSNFKNVEKRIEKLKASMKAQETTKSGSNPLNVKETEDLFKIAFRNYANLIAVADSKAGLLINVNSIIISVTIAFVVSRSEKYPSLTWPSFILLAVCFVTVLLGILASRPQHNQQIEDKESQSYQTFFFGSFDLIDKGFARANWLNFQEDLDKLMKGGKENVYEQMYREAYNVRKVLSKKFTYLSAAYWVFIIGLFVSIISFFIKTYQGS